jgi:hypothetical protein
MMCLPVVNDLFLLVFRLVKTSEDLLASPTPCSLEDPEVYWDTLSWLYLPRSLQVDSYPWHKSVLVSNPSKFEQASEWARKVFTSSRFYLPWYLLDEESTLMAWFWRVFILLFARGDQACEFLGFKWPQRVDLRRLGLALILACSMLIGFLED